MTAGGRKRAGKAAVEKYRRLEEEKKMMPKLEREIAGKSWVAKTLINRAIGFPKHIAGGGHDGGPGGQKRARFHRIKIGCCG